MKKKIVLGSVIITLLMLVSTQIMFLNIVKSDPEAHTGDADIGDLWISELDVSSDLATIDYIGISHTEATDDWVIWDEGTGNINASWEVDIEARNHPEYYIIFSFVVYNVDDNGNEIGNDSFSKTYTAGMDYDESGTLTVALEFTQQQQQMGKQTLVCYIGAYARVNDTIEAVNFSCIANDRCVVAVDFTTPETQPPFSVYRDRANDEFPSMWSWIKEWDLSARFADEDDMLNTQTFFIVGEASSTQQQHNYSWNLGTFDVRLRFSGLLQREDFTAGNTIVDWSVGNDSYVRGWAYVNYTIINVIKELPVRFRAILVASEPAIPELIAVEKYTNEYPDTSGTFRIPLEVYNGTSTRGSDDYIDVNGWIWGATILPCWRVKLSEEGSYKIHINQSVNQDSNVESDTYYWEESCSYLNETSADLSVTSSTQSGVTTVDADISNALGSSNKCVYSFAADRGDTRVVFSC